LAQSLAVRTEAIQAQLGYLDECAARVRYALELRPRQWIERPAFGTMLTRGGRAVERPLAFAPIEASEMTARQRRPEDAVAIDVSAAVWYGVDLCDGRLSDNEA
jgi:hypothetical protein